MKHYIIEAYGTTQAINRAKKWYDVNNIRDITEIFLKYRPQDIEFFAAQYLQKHFAKRDNDAILFIEKPGKYRTHLCKHSRIRKTSRPKLKRIVEIRSKATDKVYGTAKGQTEAKRLARKLMRDYAEDLYAITTYVATGPDFCLEVVHAKNYLGKYHIFIAEPEDVHIYTIKKLGY